LVDIALRDGAAVALYTDDRVPEIPPQVELNPDIHEAILWADFMAVDLSIESRLDYNNIFGIPRAKNLSPRTQVLISSPLPCGLGTCGACAVKGTAGWKLACVDGPVFPLADLE
jgi:dihydroorotate dehydrogenase electron transfer subunit